MLNKLLRIIYLLPLFTAGVLCGQEGDAPPPSSQQGMWHTFVMIAVAFLFFYLILWRPEQKRRRVLEDRRSALCKGDKVTAMGIIGIVSKVQESTIILKMIDGAKIEVVKAAVTDVHPGDGDKIQNTP